MMPLSGDPEIDSLVPALPRVLAELIWFVLDRSRLLVIGTLNGSVLPKQMGEVNVVEFASAVDGTRSIAQLICDDEGRVREDRRFVLLMFFTHGFLEDATRSGNFEEASPALSFLARVMDQTRVWNNREDLQRQLRRPLNLVGAPETVATALRAAGVNVLRGDIRDAEDSQLTVVFVGPDADLTDIERLRADASPTVLVSLHADELRIGPMLLGRGTTSLAAYRSIHAGGAGPTDYLALWDMIVANAILLIHSRTAPFNLLNQYIEYRRSETGLSTRTVFVPRCAEDSDSEIGARIFRQTQLAALPARYAGHKAYEAHYSRKYLEAARQIPRATADTSAVADDAANSHLLRALDIAFGYRIGANGTSLRNCPTGGNLGSPEAMVLHCDAANQRQTLYQFVPSPPRLARVAQCEWNAPQGAASRYVVAAIGNVAKLRFKYKVLGENVVQLDAGMAAAFFEAAVCAAGVDASRFEHGASDADLLTHWLAARRQVYVLTWRCVLPVRGPRRSLFGSRARQERLRSVIEGRRATRELTPTGYSVPKIAALIDKARPANVEDDERDVMSRLRLLLFVNERDVNQAFQLSVDQGRLVSIPLHGVRDSGNLLCQKTLSASPIKLFFFVDLPQLLDRHGAAGHDLALQLAGRWAGRLWLDAEGQGLSGCPAGAVAECDILAQINEPHAESWFNLFCFNLGRRKSGHG